MIKKSEIWIPVVVVLVALTGLFLHKYENTHHTTPGTYADEAARRAGACPGDEKIIESETKKFKMIQNWYECKPLQAGELVWYRYSFTKEPVVRTLVAVPGDTFSLKKDNGGWFLIVNEKIASDSAKKPFVFGNPARAPVLSLYAPNGKGVLKPRQAIVFLDGHAGSLDSGMFGVVNADDFLGKIESEIK